MMDGDRKNHISTDLCGLVYDRQSDPNDKMVNEWGHEEIKNSPFGLELWILYYNVGNWGDLRRL